MSRTFSIDFGRPLRWLGLKWLGFRQFANSFDHTRSQDLTLEEVKQALAGDVSEHDAVTTARLEYEALVRENSDIINFAKRLRDIEAMERTNSNLLRQILARLPPLSRPELSSIKLQFTPPVTPIIVRKLDSPQLLQFDLNQFQKGPFPAMSTTPTSPQPVPGPVNAVVGQATTASVLYFDQNGNPMPAGFTAPVTFSIDNPVIASSTPNADGTSDAVVALAAGVANLTATVQGPNGPLSNSEPITVTAVVFTPVLSSIQLAFTPPA